MGGLPIVFNLVLAIIPVQWYNKDKLKERNRKGIKMMLAMMVQKYDEKSYTHNYIIGIKWKKQIIACVMTSAVLGKITILDRASRGAGYSLRFKPNMTTRLYLLRNALMTFKVCSAEELERVAREEVGKRTNRGSAFEKLVTEYFGQEWHKDSVPFTEAGDIEVNGKAYQIKFEGATFCNEKQLRA